MHLADYSVKKGVGEGAGGAGSGWKQCALPRAEAPCLVPQCVCLRDRMRSVSLCGSGII